MATVNKIWMFTDYYGGGADAVNGSGAPFGSLVHGDLGIATVGGYASTFRWNSASEAAEDTENRPYRIKAYGQGTNPGMWEEQRVPSALVNHDLTEDYVGDEHNDDETTRTDSTLPLGLHRVASDPSEPADGQIWVNTSAYPV